MPLYNNDREKKENTNTDIEYIHIEMVFNQKGKPNKYEVVSGLFQGTKTHNDSIFILLHGKKDATNILNLDFYDIMTIEVRYKEHKDITYLTAKSNDQKLALTLLDTLHKNCLKDSSFKQNEEDLIKISKYINVPKEYYDTGTQLKTPEYVNKNYNTVANNSYNSNKKKEIRPFVFGRVGTTKPSKNHLVLMQKKLDQINANEFECNLPDIFVENSDIKDKNIHNLYDEIGNYCE